MILRAHAWLKRLLMLSYCAMLCAALDAAAAPLRGNPPIEKFSPNIEVDSQNFCITQDSRGIIFVCNASGVVEFDGERWKLHKMPNREMVRSLAVDATDNVYVGGYNLFGVLRRNAAGEAKLEDYSAKFKTALAGREFADIWEVVVAPEGIYFRGLQDLFFIDPKTNAAHHWFYLGKFGFLRHDGGRTLVQFRGEGIKVRDGNNWRLLPATAVIKAPVFLALPLADKSLLVFGNDKSWWKLSGDIATIQPMPPGTPEPTTVLNATLLADGSLALANIEGKVFIIDNQLLKTRAFKLEAGVISGIYPDRRGGFLAVADLAVYRVAWPSPWSVLGIEQGGGGPLAGYAQWNAKRYVMSDAGGFEIIEGSDGRLTFSTVPWVNTAAYALHPLSKSRALLSGADRLKLIENNVATDVVEESLYPRTIWPSRHHAKRLYLGTETGLRLLDTSGKKIVVSAAIPNDNPVQFQTMAEASATEVWFGSERHGIWRVQLNEDGSVQSAAQLRGTAAALGLQYGEYPSATIIGLKNGAIIASTGAGIFAWDGSKFVQTEFDGLVAMRTADETLHLAQAPDGSLWAFSNVRVWKQGNDKKWVQQDIQNLRKGSIADVVFDAAGNAILVNSHGLLMHQALDPTAAVPTRAPAQLLLRSVTQTLADGTQVALPLNPLKSQQMLQLNIADSAVRFDFALPDYAKAGAARYQGRLVGEEAALSDWAVSSSYIYSTLAAGHFSMQIRSKDIDGNITEMPAYDFEILPPWYRRTGMMVLWWVGAALSVVALFLGLTRRRTATLLARNLNLESKVSARTIELEAANVRLESLARLDGLTGIPNRRCLDEYLAQAWTKAAHEEQSIAALVMDVDHFKLYNDLYGHQAGDALLRHIATSLSNCLTRPGELLARYGGEEFVAVLPNVSLDEAIALAETMRCAIETGLLSTPPPLQNRSRTRPVQSTKVVSRTTISVGVSHCQPNKIGDDDDDDSYDANPAEQLVHEADSALYAAKAAGRNCVRVFAE